MISIGDAPPNISLDSANRSFQTGPYSNFRALRNGQQSVDRFLPQGLIQQPFPPESILHECESRRTVNCPCWLCTGLTGTTLSKKREALGAIASISLQERSAYLAEGPQQSIPQ